MEIRNLKTFLKIAAVGNFTAAAKELGYSQSNVSAQIKQLEEELGSPLFNRIGRTITLTQYGESLLPYAHSIVSSSVQMETVMKASDHLEGTVRIGMVDSFFDTIAEELFPAYHEEYPLVQTQVIVDSTENLEEMLRQGVIDLACLIDYPLPENEWQILFSLDVPIAALANPGHPLCKAGSLALSDLATDDLIMMETSSPVNEWFQQTLAKEKCDANPFLRLPSPNVTVDLIQKQKWITLQPVYAAVEAVEKGRIAILNIPRVNTGLEAQLILHKHKVIVPQLRGMADHLSRLLEELTARGEALLP